MVGRVSNSSKRNGDEPNRVTIKGVRKYVRGTLPRIYYLLRRNESVKITRVFRIYTVVNKTGQWLKRSTITEILTIITDFITSHVRTRFILHEYADSIRDT